MLIGYARVSREEQNADLQRDALKAAGCKKIFEEKASGAKTERAELEKALEALRDGEDTLVIWKLDRLGRSLKHLIEIVEGLRARGIQFKSLQDNIDTSTPSGLLFFHMCGAFAEYERNIIRERTRAGLAATRARGRKGGRPRGMDESRRAMALALRKDTSRPIAQICKTLGISRSTFYKYTQGAPRAEGTDQPG